MKCEYCNKEHNGSYGSGRFCSSKCARSFSIKQDNKNELKESKCIKCGKIIFINKRSSHITKCEECKPTKCIKCGNKLGHSNKSGYCKKCVQSLKEVKEKISIAQKKLVKDGNHKGWQSRNIRSYPEIFFDKVLKDHYSGEYIIEFPIKKRDLGINCNSNYFLDYFFPKLKINLEIDGKQHENIERKESDKKRDILLKKIGIIVYRIKWKNINTNEGKEYIKNEINSFFSFIEYKKEFTAGLRSGVS